MEVTVADELWLGLLNSDWHDYRGSGRREDRLDNPDWLADYLRPWADDLAGVPEAETRDALRRLRGILRRIVDSFTAGEGAADADWQALNRYFEESPLVRRLSVSPDCLRLAVIPVRPGLPALLAEIAAAFAAAVSRGDPQRIKVCENRDCNWVFYDHSKNRSRKWCESTCGNLLKVRRFREKEQH
jgi:predicted RNA-binding Zn ribbon-like protein